MNSSDSGVAALSFGATQLFWFLIVTVLLVAIWIRYRKNQAFSFWYTIFLLVAYGIAFLLIRFPPIYSDFPRALGHAFIIAAILAATVDHYLKERVLHEVSLDVSKYLVGYRLPEEMQDRIRELMQSRWIRRRFEVRAAFSEIGARKIKMDVHIREEIQNITSESLEYEDRIEFQKHDNATLLELQCDSEDSNCSYHLEGHELASMTTERAGRFITYGKKVRIPPAAESIDRSYHFRARYEMVLPNEFSDVISFNHPTIGVSIEITDAPKNYRFDFMPAGDQVGHNRWEYKRLFMPGEHIRIIWSRGESETRA